MNRLFVDSFCSLCRFCSLSSLADLISLIDRYPPPSSPPTATSSLLSSSQLRPSPTDPSTSPPPTPSTQPSSPPLLNSSSSPPPPLLPTTSSRSSGIAQRTSSLLPRPKTRRTGRLRSLRSGRSLPEGTRRRGLSGEWISCRGPWEGRTDTSWRVLEETVRLVWRWG